MSTTTPLWATHLSAWDQSLMWGLPLGALVAILFVLRVWWRPKGGPKFRLPSKTVPTYGTADSDGELSGAYAYDGESNDLIYAGQVSGQYDMPWTKTFDATFLIGMVLLGVVLSAVTSMYAPTLWEDGGFWLWLVPKFLLMMAVSLIGGLIARRFCTVDEHGYVVGERNARFQVTYTRKCQLLAAYVIPLLVNPRDAYEGPLQLAWGEFATLLGFLVLIKPLRERSTFFMLQFNALDRPEDRPHTLKWSVAGNAFPAMAVLLCFRTLFATTSQADLVFVLIFITSIGSGLAEPVSQAWGQHKYTTTTCLSNRKYMRSYEGSAVVFISAMVFPALQFFDFVSAKQLWITMLALPFAATYAEATAPYAMDGPVIMVTIGLVLFVILHVV